MNREEGMILPHTPPAFLEGDGEIGLTLEVVKLSADVALMAVAMSRLNDASQIADNLYEAFDGCVQLGLLVATVRVASGKSAEALPIMEDLVRSHPHIDATTLCCAALKKDLGLGSWRDLAEGVLNRASDPNAVRQARELLYGPQSATERKADTCSAAVMRFA
jgi:hypothetical protein